MLTGAKFLPITLEETRQRGWDGVDVVLVSGDAYVDHPAFGTAVIGRTLEAAGYRVAIIPQPNVPKEQERGSVESLRDFCKFGRPRLFFGVTSGVMDSMVNHYTAARRLRHDDAYTPGGMAGFRPDYATYVYSRILKRLYPDVPVVIGGIEASMRRLTHYDYWADRLRPSILCECPADLLVYGMGECTMRKIADVISNGGGTDELRRLPQVGYRTTGTPADAGDTISLHSHESCQKDKMKEAENFRIIERESNKMVCSRLVQRVGEDFVVINPPEPPMTTEEIDASFELPYMRRPHPKYKKRGAIPAFEMIRWSVNTHRGCFGGCSFCTISAHQGKQIASRSEESILREVAAITRDPEFKGVLSDLGGPSANMYGMGGKDKSRCLKCARYSCIQPSICPNLDSDHGRLIDLYRKVAAMPGVKHLYIGSGIRCDLFTGGNQGWKYFEEVVHHHVSGRLKVAPEHASAAVLHLMRKPGFDLFVESKQRFDEICRKAGLPYQLIPYFISSHPGCRLRDMAELALKLKRLGYRLEQIQDFTPTPMTLSTEMYYTGVNPETMQPVYVPRHPNEKHEQKQMFFYYKKEFRQEIASILRRAHLEQYIGKLL
ncbi:MAG: YgiQ family radical SAM protein [Bacteroidales bacterium]|nr:YgiQ family radical SAM protein [Bacteroidales bacterium]